MHTASKYRYIYGLHAVIIALTPMNQRGDGNAGCHVSLSAQAAHRRSQHTGGCRRRSGIAGRAAGAQAGRQSGCESVLQRVRHGSGGDGGGHHRAGGGRATRRLRATHSQHAPRADRGIRPGGPGRRGLPYIRQGEQALRSRRNGHRQRGGVRAHPVPQHRRHRGKPHPACSGPADPDGGHERCGRRHRHQGQAHGGHRPAAGSVARHGRAHRPAARPLPRGRGAGRGPGGAGPAAARGQPAPGGRRRGGQRRDRLPGAGGR